MTESYIQLPTDGTGKKTRTNLIGDVHQQIVQLADSAGNFIKISRKRENLSGASGSHSDGDTNRVFTLTSTDDLEITEVFLDGVLLIETSQYTVDNTARTVEIILNVFDSQTVTVFYYV